MCVIRLQFTVVSGIDRKIPLLPVGMWGQGFTRDSCTGRYCWERVLAMAILSVRPSVCHDPVRIQGQVR